MSRRTGRRPNFKDRLRLEGNVDEPSVDLEAYKQVNEDLRHYSKLRMTYLAIFLAISGALFDTALKEHGPPIKFGFSSVAGIVIAFVFAFVEHRINTGLEFFRRQNQDLGKHLGMSKIALRWPPRTRLQEWAAPIQMMTIYVGAILLWIVAIFARLTGQL
jgi:hypothetical protein